MNPKPIKLNGNAGNVYMFKQEYLEDPTKREEANTLLSGYVKEYNDLLKSNPTLGKKLKIV